MERVHAAPVKRADCVIQFDLRCMQTHNLATDTSKTAQIALGAHATAIHNNSRVGKIAIVDGSLPMRLNARLFKSKGHRFQKATIVDLCFAGDVQRCGKSCAELGFYFSYLRTFQALDPRLRLTQGEHALSTGGFSCVLAVPEQESSGIAIEDGDWQLSQPLRP